MLMKFAFCVSPTTYQLANLVGKSNNLQVDICIGLEDIASGSTNSIYSAITLFSNVTYARLHGSPSLLSMVS